MPGKKGNIRSKDYKGLLRKPREKQDSSTTQDGGDDSSSAPSESEKSKDEASKMERMDKVIKLSPFAAEFVPRGAFSLQSAVNAPEFVPSLSQQTDRPVLLRQRSDKPGNELMNRVKKVLVGLTQSPGELNSYFYTLVKLLRKWLSSLDSLKEVVDFIFEYSITEPNFQYIAAKLCDMLSKEQNIVPSNGEKFRSLLMNRCRDEHVNREASLKNPESSARLLGFAMFEAELFCNYRLSGESEPLKVFHRGLLEMLNTLLQNHTEDCLRCIGKILKMTGYLLDDPRFMKEDKDRKNKVDKVFFSVQKLSQGPGLSESVKSLLSQVIALRATKWDSDTSGGASGVYAYFPTEDDYFSEFAPGMDELNLDDDLTPVTNPEQWSDYYDDSDETALMHQTYKYYFPDRDNEEYSHVEDEEYFLDEDPEFDDEIDAEFEKFLQEQERF